MPGPCESLVNAGEGVGVGDMRVAALDTARWTRVARGACSGARHDGRSCEHARREDDRMWRRLFYGFDLLYPKDNHTARVVTRTTALTYTRCEGPSFQRPVADSSHSWPLYSRLV